MSTTAPIQGKDVLLSISTDNGTTWKKVVCLIKQGYELSMESTRTVTQCGALVGIGLATESIPFEGALNIVPAGDASTDLSFKELKTIAKAGNAIMYKQAYAATPAIIDSEGKAYLKDLKADIPVNNVVTFSATLEAF